MPVNNSKKIAFAATITALCWILLFLTRFLPVGVLFLYMAAGILLGLNFTKAGIPYGFVSFIAVSLIAIFIVPYGYPYLVCFAPHSIVVGLFEKYALKKGLKEFIVLIVRALISFLIGALGFYLTLLLSSVVFDFERLFEIINIKAFVYIVVALAFAVYDYAYSRAVSFFARRIKFIK